MNTIFFLNIKTQRDLKKEASAGKDTNISSTSQESSKKTDQSKQTDEEQTEQNTTEYSKDKSAEGSTVSVNALGKPELSKELTSDYKPKLSWKAVEGADYYELYRYNDKTEEWDKLDATTDFSYIDNKTEDNNTYSYRLYAVRKTDGKALRSEYAEASIKLESKKAVRALIVDYETNSSKRMVKYLKKAGFVVNRVESIDAFNVEDYDTLVIPGGHNITPSIYGAKRHEKTYGTNEELDHLQIDAVKIFCDAKKPVLGVCRGCQLVNVALGGTINQHIPGWHKKYRTVKIDEKSWLYKRLGTTESVYHYHHQCVEDLAPGLVATQWDEQDDHIEAYEHETLPVYGIQWHPDSMGKRGVDVFKYYKELVTKYYQKSE